MIRRGTPRYYVREALHWAVVLAIAIPLTVGAFLLFVLPVFIFVLSVFVPR